MLNKYYEKIGKIHYLVEVDKDSIIVNNSSKYYRIPIYSLDELLDMEY